MKRILLPIGLFFICSVPLFAEMDVFETIRGTGTVIPVLVSSSTSLNLDSGGRELKRRKAVEIWNDDTTKMLFCSFDTAVSSITTSNYRGRRVEPRKSLYWAIPDVVDPYCVADTSNTLVIYTQFY